MTQIDTSKWGKFRVGDLFEFNRGKEVAPNRNLSGDCPLILESGENNGYSRNVVPTKIFNGNAITVSVNYAANVFYQESKFCASVNIIILRNKYLNKYSGLFIAAILSKNNLKYDYNNKISKDKLFNETIPLPVTPNMSPDWQFMEDYMKETTKVAAKRVEKLKKEKTETKIDTSNWKKFKVGELFDCNIAKSLDFGKLEKGNTIFIGRTSTNNGVQGKVNAPPCEKGNCITVGMVGDNKAFYQPQEFAASQNILVLRNKRLNEKNGLFFAALINSLLAKYNYSNTVKKKEFINESILLPITPEGTPDFDYMENYMKNLTEKAKKKFSDISQ